MGRLDISPIHEVVQDGEGKQIRVQDGHLFVCAQGCCCGRTEKGFAPVPLERFKTQWKARGIRHRFHLTISGCLGPCALANVVMVQFRGEPTWLHSISDPSDVDLIYDWAEEMLQADRCLPPPPALARRQFQRYLVDSIDQSACAITLGANGNADEV